MLNSCHDLKCYFYEKCYLKTTSLRNSIFGNEIDYIIQELSIKNIDERGGKYLTFFCNEVNFIVIVYGYFQKVFV